MVPALAHLLGELASKDIADTLAEAVDDNGARVALLREVGVAGARPVVGHKDCLELAAVLVAEVGVQTRDEAERGARHVARRDADPDGLAVLVEALRCGKFGRGHVSAHAERSVGSELWAVRVFVVGPDEIAELVVVVPARG